MKNDIPKPFYVLFGFFVHYIFIYQCCQILWPFLLSFHGLVLLCSVYVKVSFSPSSKMGQMCVQGNVKLLRCQ
jgi:hypothetical protein